MTSSTQIRRLGTPKTHIEIRRDLCLRTRSAMCTERRDTIVLTTLRKNVKRYTRPLRHRRQPKGDPIGRRPMLSTL